MVDVQKNYEIGISAHFKTKKKILFFKVMNWAYIKVINWAEFGDQKRGQPGQVNNFEISRAQFSFY